MDARTTTSPAGASTRRAAVDVFSGALATYGRACTAARIAVNTFCLAPNAQNRALALAALDQVETAAAALTEAQQATRK